MFSFSAVPVIKNKSILCILSADLAANLVLEYQYTSSMNDLGISILLIKWRCFDVTFFGWNGTYGDMQVPLSNKISFRLFFVESINNRPL